MPPDSFSVNPGISKHHLRRCVFCTNHHKLDSMCSGLRLQLLGILDSKTAAVQIDACSPTKCFYFTVVATAESRQEGNIVMGLQLLSQTEFASSWRPNSRYRIPTSTRLRALVSTNLSCVSLDWKGSAQLDLRHHDQVAHMWHMHVAHARGTRTWHTHVAHMPHILV